MNDNESTTSRGSSRRSNSSNGSTNDYLCDK